MSTIVEVPLSKIRMNPFRQIGDYPFIPQKLEALERSIKDVGLWEGILARRCDGGYEIAFGHHRIAAAANTGLKNVPLIVRDLSDKEMVQFMGRENLEDYATDFLRMLESWEAGRKFLAGIPAKEPEAIEVARLLGWILKKRDDFGLNELARACYGAQRLIAGGHLTRSDLSGMAVYSAREIVERTIARHDQLERAGSQAKRPHEEIKRAKAHVTAAAKRTAREVREDKVTRRDIRSRIDLHAYKGASKDKKPSPLFAFFAKALSDGIERMLTNDSTAERLEQVAKAVPKMTMEEDRAALRRIDFVLGEHVTVTENWRKRIVPPGQKIVPIEQLRLLHRKEG